MSTIRYFIPEDGDTEACPNVFLAPKSAKPGYPPLLGQVRSAFPLPGKYHFRFKSPLVPGSETRNGGGGIAVWMDCTDDAQPVGVWNNSIVAKVTRISYDDDDSDDEFETTPTPTTTSNGFHHSHSAPPSVAGTPHVTPRSTPPPMTDTMPATVQEDHLNIFDDNPTPAPVSTRSAGATPPPSGNLLGGLDDPAPTSGANSEASLLDMNHAPSSANSASSHDFFGASGGTSSAGAHDDLLNMSAPVPAPQAQHHPPPGAAAPRVHHANHHGFHGGMGMTHQQQQQQQARPSPPGGVQRPANFGNAMHGKPQQANRVSSGTYGQGGPMSGGMGNAQQQRGGTRQNGGSGNGQNAFDSFKKNQSPFAEFGNFT